MSKMEDIAESMEGIADSLDRCFRSPNVADIIPALGSDWKVANVVDTIDSLARGAFRIANAITANDASAAHTPDGGYVASLTEAVMYAAESLSKIADAIDRLADGRSD